MNPDQDTLRIERVANGWTICQHTYCGMRDGDMPGETFVARTPAELGNLLIGWATAQEFKVKADK